MIGLHLPRHIASPFAQRGVARWLLTKRPQAVLEIGGGAGTLTRIGRHLCPRWAVVEPLEEFRVVIPGEVYQAPPTGIFEGVVLDGEPSPDWAALDRCRWAFVEGNRRAQRAELLQAWPSAVQWQRRPWDRSKGYWLVIRHPGWRDRGRAVVAALWEAVLGVVALVGGYSCRGKRR